MDIEDMIESANEALSVSNILQGAFVVGLLYGSYIGYHNHKAKHEDSLSPSTYHSSVDETYQINRMYESKTSLSNLMASKKEV